MSWSPSVIRCSVGRSRAFTLVELIVLIIIIAILSAMVVPRYTAYLEHTRFQHTTENVISLLDWARSAAGEHGGGSVVRFDPQTATLTVNVEAAASDQDQPSALQETETVSNAQSTRSYFLGEDVAISDFVRMTQPKPNATNNPEDVHPMQYRCYEDGSSDGARIMLVSRHGYQAALEVSPLSGRVRELTQDEMQR